MLPSNSFSIPSGVFIRHNKSFGQCKVELTYSGDFYGSSASRTASGKWNCSEAIDPTHQNTTFKVSHGIRSKSNVGDIETVGITAEYMLR